MLHRFYRVNLLLIPFLVNLYSQQFSRNRREGYRQFDVLISHYIKTPLPKLLFCFSLLFCFLCHMLTLRSQIFTLRMNCHIDLYIL